MSALRMVEMLEHSRQTNVGTDMRHYTHPDDLSEECDEEDDDDDDQEIDSFYDDDHDMYISSEEDVENVLERIKKEDRHKVTDLVDIPTVRQFTDRTEQFDANGDLNLDFVLQMNPKQLDRLEREVFLLEHLNDQTVYSLFGPFPEVQEPFPRLVCMGPNERPKQYSPQYRELLWAQYRNMCRIRRDPSRCVNQSLVRQAENTHVKSMVDLACQKMHRKFYSMPNRKGTAVYSQSHRKQRTKPVNNVGTISLAQQRPLPSFTLEEQEMMVADNLAQEWMDDYHLQLMLLEQQNRRRLKQGRMVRQAVQEEKFRNASSSSVSVPCVDSLEQTAQPSKFDQLVSAIRDELDDPNKIEELQNVAVRLRDLYVSLGIGDDPMTAIPYQRLDGEVVSQTLRHMPCAEVFLRTYAGMLKNIEAEARLRQNLNDPSIRHHSSVNSIDLLKRKLWDVEMLLLEAQEFEQGSNKQRAQSSSGELVDHTLLEKSRRSVLPSTEEKGGHCTKGKAKSPDRQLTRLPLRGRGDEVVPQKTNELNSLTNKDKR